MKTLPIRLISSCLVLLTALTIVVSQQNSAPSQKLRIVSYSGDLQSLLEQLPSLYDITLGLEVVPTEPRSLVTFEVHEATFEDVMDAIIKATPLYSWRQTGNVVEVYPSKGTSPLLDLTVASFHVKDVIAVEALNQLLGLNEVQAAMNASQLRPQTDTFDPGKDPGRRITIDRENTKLRNILSLIANESGSKFWSFQQTGPQKKAFAITFTR